MSQYEGCLYVSPPCGDRGVGIEISDLTGCFSGRKNLKYVAHILLNEWHSDAQKRSNDILFCVPSSSSILCVARYGELRSGPALNGMLEVTQALESIGEATSSVHHTWMNLLLQSGVRSSGGPGPWSDLRKIG